MVDGPAGPSFMDETMFDLKGYEASLLEGAWVTLQVSLLSVVLAMILSAANAYLGLFAGLTIAIALFLIAGLAWLAYWFFFSRHHESTDNAYVSGNMVMVNAQTIGTVETILADENQEIKAGQVLIKLNPTDAQVALSQAQAQLAQATRQIQNAFNSAGVANAQLSQARSAVQTAQDAVNRRAKLVGTGAVSKEEYDQARNALVQAQAAYKTATEQSKTATAQIAGTTTQNHPSIEAAKAAKIHNYIMSLPDGYDTIVNGDGLNISQGQKQMLTIARAMLSDAKMLILDEATSNVDTRTEMQIQSAMRNLMKDKTCFVIAHRLSTVQNADTILVV